MIDLTRIVENQASLSSYRATQDEEKALQLELLIENSKPRNAYTEWHPLIATPFRYSPPLKVGRFRASYGKNVFYGSLIEETALYEHAYHFIKERKHLKLQTDTGVRTIFFVSANDKNAERITLEAKFMKLLDKNDYSFSHQFIEKNSKTTFIIYPSCRDPKKRNNAAILDINHLDKNLISERAIKYFYDNKQKQLTWIDYPLHIQWSDVN